MSGPIVTPPAPGKVEVTITNLPLAGTPPSLAASVQQEKKHWIHTWADTGSKLMVIAAAIVGAVWSFTVFKETVAPGLETKLDAGSELHWAVVPGTDICQASFQVKVKNAGKTPFDIETVRVSARLVDLKATGLLPGDVAHPVAMDPEKINAMDAFYDGPGGPISNDISGHYTEGTESTGSFDLFFKYTPRTSVLMLANVEGNRPSSYWPFFSKQVPLQNYTYQLDQLCGGNWDSHEIPKAKQNSTKPAATPKK